jgi:hypothetical protein
MGSKHCMQSAMPQGRLYSCFSFLHTAFLGLGLALECAQGHAQRGLLVVFHGRGGPLLLASDDGVYQFAVPANDMLPVLIALCIEFNEGLDKSD